MGIRLAALFRAVQRGAALEAPAASGGEWVPEGHDAQACFAIEQLPVSQPRYLSIDTHGLSGLPFVGLGLLVHAESVNAIAERPGDAEAFPTDAESTGEEAETDR